MDSGKVLLGVLAGVAVGATLGILFAPEKGSVTRKKIAKKGNDYADELGDKFNEFIEMITDRFEEAKEDVQKISENGMHKVDHVKAELSSNTK